LRYLFFPVATPAAVYIPDVLGRRLEEGGGKDPANLSVSIFPLDKKTFLCFQDLTLWTPPGIRKGFKGGSRGDSAFGISLFGIVHIGTFEALPAIHILFRHTEMVGPKVDKKYVSRTLRVPGMLDFLDTRINNTHLLR
jgi:hypothetical protein